MVHITYFVHGTTTDNEQGVATGWLPGELSIKGKQQSKVLAELVSDTPFDIVFCSDLQRAIETANIVFGPHHHIAHDDRLREANYGDFNGKPHIFKDNMVDYIDAPFPNGESYRDVEVRMQAFCDFLESAYAGKHVAIVAHQAPQLALDVILRGKSWGQAIMEDWRRSGAFQPGWKYDIV